MGLLISSFPVILTSMRHFWLAGLFFVGLSILFPQSLFAQKINKDAHELSQYLPNSKINGGNSAQAAEQMKRILGIVAKTNRNSRSTVRSLVNKAMDFRDDIGEYQKVVTTNSILNVWETAFLNGAMNAKTKVFTGRATRGRYQGQDLVFENIIPAKMAPEYAGYIGNIRLVPKETVRKGDAISSREAGFAKELISVKREAEVTSKVVARENDNSAEEEKQKKEAEMYAAEVASHGELVNNKPTLRLDARKTASATRSNGQRYAGSYRITNLSDHPTEVQATFRLLGVTDHKNLLYEMASVTTTVKLRKGEFYEDILQTANVTGFAPALEVFDPEKSKKVDFRGYVLSVKFKDEIIAFNTSGGRLERVGSGETSVPTIQSLMPKKKK